MIAQDATWRSANIRAERARLRTHVAAGGSLTILLTEERPAMRNVEIGSLVKWMPLVGDVKAKRILGSFPPRAKLCELTQAELYRFTYRVAQHERRILTKRFQAKETP